MHGWMKWAFALFVTQGIATNSKAIASYTQTVMQFDTKLAFLKIASWKQLCVVMINICTFNTVV